MPPRDTAPASRSSLTNKCLISVKMGACGHVEYVVFLLCPIMNQFLMELGKFMGIVYSSEFDLSDKEMNWCVAFGVTL